MKAQTGQRTPWYTRKHVVVDFNGVVCINRSPAGHEEGRITGEMRNETWRILKEYLDAGHKVIIATARHDLDQVKLWMTFEAKKARRLDIVPRLTFERKPMAFITIDDRAHKFTGTFPTLEEIASFKTWEKPEAVSPIISDSEALPSQSHMSIEEVAQAASNR